MNHQPSPSAATAGRYRPQKRNPPPSWTLRATSGIWRLYRCGRSWAAGDGYEWRVLLPTTYAWWLHEFGVDA